MPPVIEERRATLADLLRCEGPAELIGGRIVRFMPSGRRHGRLVGWIFLRLQDYVQKTGRGEAHTDGVGYAVDELPSGRASFSPDVSYHTIPPQADDSNFIAGAPDFAVEVRSQNDYGPTAERSLAAKRADYFQAGTLAVWDVDPVAECIHLYSAATPDSATVFTVTDLAHAEPALPGWTLPVGMLFAKPGV
ncbi:MAG: Uma2 family endonuclease [Gemmataceae bacterium]